MNHLLSHIGASVIERDEEIRAIALGLIAGEHTLLVGPPGTAKSYLCRCVAAAFSDMRFCERLLSPTTAPEEVFGPISIAALREDRYEHVGEGSISDAELVFLDEFFRSSDAIMDKLLHAMGPERQALLGTQQVKMPLISAVGATNSWPDSAHQQAIFDRWLIRRTVRPVSRNGRERLMYETLPEVTPVCSLAELTDAQLSAAALPVSDAAKGALANILDELSAAGIRPSDRRCRASVKVARAAAFLDGATEVEPGHLEPLADVLWDDPSEQPVKCAEIVVRIANPVGARLNEILRECAEMVEQADDSAKKMAAIKKLEQSEKEARKLSAAGNGRAAKCYEFVRSERVRLQAAALGMDPAQVEKMLAAGK